MSGRKQKPSANAKRNRRTVRGGMVLGVFVGLVLGLAIALGVAYYLGRTGLAPHLPGAATKDGARAGKPDAAVTAAAPDKPRFDFYKILPGAEEPKVGTERKPTDKACRARSMTRPIRRPATAPAKASERLWLQAGAFANESDAESLKARLAMSGWEAAVQAATVPDQGVRYRVRLGPYDNTDELNRIKSDLSKNGFDVAVIKNQ